MWGVAGAKADGVALLGARRSLGVDNPLWFESWPEFIGAKVAPKLEWLMLSLNENYCYS